MIMIKHKKVVFRYEINDTIVTLLTDLPAGTRHSPFVRVFHTLTKHECYPPLMCNNFERTHSKEQVMGITARMYTTVELMVHLNN